MLYTICIGLVLVASVLMILAVLVQSPKSGMAANFGASNQVMGVRQTTDFLEKFTWAMSIAILVISLMATVAMGNSMSTGSSKASKDAEKIIEHQMEQAPVGVPQAEAPIELEAEEAVATEAVEIE